jgi:hypothetical protein
MIKAMSRLRLYLIAGLIVLVGAGYLIGFALTLNLFLLVLLIGTVAGLVAWSRRQAVLRRRHQAGGMTSWGVKLAYGEKESAVRFNRLLIHLASLGGFQVAYVGECEINERGHETVNVEFRLTVDDNQAKSAREKVLREYPDAFVYEADDSLTSELIDIYLHNHPYVPLRQQIAGLWSKLLAPRSERRAGLNQSARAGWRRPRSMDDSTRPEAVASGALASREKR